jgi:hypothetical protein
MDLGVEFMPQVTFSIVKTISTYLHSRCGIPYFLADQNKWHSTVLGSFASWPCYFEANLKSLDRSRRPQFSFDSLV